MSEQRIFLSYDHDDSPFVKAVAAALGNRGVQAQFATGEFEPGDAWSSSLRESLRSSSVLVAFVGEHADSPWFNFELGAAPAESKAVVPVFLSYRGRETAPSVLRSLHGIEAFDLSPEQVADEITYAVSS
jgi:TIR domain